VVDTGGEQRLLEYSPHLEKWFDITVNSTVNGLTVFFRDVTEMRSLTEQLHQAQRLESVGRLTGGIAHDFNNLLTVVIGSAEALTLDHHNLSDDATEMLDMITRAAGRGADDLRADISRYSSRAIESCVVSSLDDVVQQELIEGFIARVGAGSGAQS
jgi:signal transduction histidine kinase